MTNLPMSNSSKPLFNRWALPFSVFGLMLAMICPIAAQEARRGSAQTAAANVPRTVLLRVIRAEDERRWDNDLSNPFTDTNPAVRARAALAAGRIGDGRSIPELGRLLNADPNDAVKQMAAFALGETESPAAGDVLMAELAKRHPAAKARIIEALGKITAALPATDETRLKTFRKAIFDALEFEAGRRSGPDTEVILLGVTAALRARPEGVGKVIAEFLTYSNARIRSDAANALARLRAKDGNATLRKLLTSDPDANVRANAARVLGATEDKEAFAGLLDRAVNDPDQRVRVSAIRALGSLKEEKPRVAKALASMWCQRKLLKTGNLLHHERDAECLELVTVLGRVFQGTGDKEILGHLDHWRWDFQNSPSELELALVRISPETYLAKLGDELAAKRRVQGAMLSDWHEASSLAQAIGEIAALPDSTNNKKELGARAEAILRAMLDFPRASASNGKSHQQPQYALPDVLRAFSAFKSKDLEIVLRKHLSEQDVVVRATAAELLGELPLNITNIEALGAALTVALKDKNSNDAALAILDALAKQKNRNANEAIKTALDSSDYLVRRKAVDSLKATGGGDFSARLGAVPTRNSPADYARAIGRMGKHVRAVVATSRGSFTLELLPEEAPLNVDNFVQLAKRRYFNGIVFHRVVPNFVIQGGDPGGDGNGGPGYQIRCEINEVPFERGVLGMALSGKDTGGSQWFVTHAPQPHLDGGYTVFGRVVEGMDVVDKIARGDRINSIVIKETIRRGEKSRR